MEQQKLLEVWDWFSREHVGVSVDRMICEPQLRLGFLDKVEEFGGGKVNEGEVLWTLMGLRKRKLVKLKSVSR